LAGQCGLNGSVAFLGNVDHSRIPELWQKADIAVLPSRTEGLPLAALEAMAHGIPVVATRAGGIPEVIRNGKNGLLVEPGDAAALAEALKQLVTDSARSRQLGKAGRLSVVEGGWSETAVTRRLVSVYGRARESRRVSEFRKHDQPNQDYLKMQDLAWVRGQLALAAGVRRVGFFMWSMNRFGEMEQCIARQVCALASAGVEVHVFIAMPAWRNRYVRRMRGAGAHVFTPSLADSLAIRAALPLLEERLPSTASRRTLAVLDRRCFGMRPDVLHVHGWRLGTAWVLPEARARNIDAVYSEHAGDNPSPLPASRLRALDAASVLSASPSAIRWFREIAGNAAPLVVIRREEAEQRRTGGARVTEVAALVATGEQNALALEFEHVRKLFPNLRLRLIPLGLDPRTLIITLAGAGIVVMSSKSSMFPVALVELMAAGKPIVICGRTGAAPVNHRVNCLIADFASSMSVAQAIQELLSKPSLAESLGEAARRKADAIEWRSLSIAHELGSFYRRARVHAMSPEGEVHAVG
jgi:glycosyltransferase involved in cell wall biosynthesis